MRKPKAKLDAEQRAALVECIEAWELKRDGLLPVDGTNTCPLCWRYVKPPEPCEGCPVMQETGQFGCVGSPYNAAEQAALRSDPIAMYADPDECAPVVCNSRAKAAATRELNFLRGILKRRG